jgi:DNA-binding CsgD family transcriptional regulator
MSQSENRISDSPFSKWIESSAPLDDDLDIVRLSAARARAMDLAGAEIARQLNGPLTALLLYMGEIKQHSQQLSQAAGNRVYLQQVVENALQQTERVCALIKQIADVHEEPAVASGAKAGWEKQVGRSNNGVRTPGVMFSSGSGQKPLTKREREVLSLISEGYSNKQGALRMSISPRTFESHRAEAMRKLGARNTADLVRLALLHPAV